MIFLLSFLKWQKALGTFRSMPFHTKPDDVKKITMKILSVSVSWLFFLYCFWMTPPGLFERDVFQLLHIHDGCYWRAPPSLAVTAAAAASFVVVAKKKRHHCTHTTTSWRVLLDASTTANNHRRPDNSSSSSSARRQPLNRKRTRPRTSTPSSSFATHTVAQQHQQQQQRRQQRRSLFRTAPTRNSTRSSPFSSGNKHYNNNNKHYNKKKKQYKQPSSSIVIQFLEETFPSTTNHTNAELAAWMQLQVPTMFPITSLSSAAAAASNNTTTDTTTTRTTVALSSSTTTMTWQQLITPTLSQQQQAAAAAAAVVWTSHDDTALIRYLRQRQAYTAVLWFMRLRQCHHYHHHPNNNNLTVIHQQQRPQPPNVFTYTAAISALALSSSSSSSSEHRQECWNLFQEMLYNKHNIRPSSYTYSALFQACHGPAEAMALYKRLVDIEQVQQQVQNNYTRNIWTQPVWESAIYACARTLTSPNDDGGLFFLDHKEKEEVEDKNGILTTTTTTNNNHTKQQTTAAAAATTNSSSRSSTTAAWDTAQFFVQRMLCCGCKLSARTYLALFLVYTQTRDWKHAKELYQSLEDEESSSNILMTPRLFGAILQVCAVTGEHVDALQILQNMQTTRNMIPNVRHCTSYLKALITSGEVEMALEFLLHMANAAHNDKSLSPTSNLNFGNLTFATPDSIAIQTVLQSCNYEQARKLLQLAQKGELGGLENMPDERFYNTVLSKCQEPTQAKDIIRQMQLSRRYRIGAVPPSKLSYTKAIAVCRKAQDVDTARFFLTSAKENGIEPDVYMYSAAIWAAAGSSDLAAALEFLAEMQANDCLPNIVSYNGVISAFAAAGDCTGAVELYETALERGLEGDRTTFYHLASAARQVKDTKERLVLLGRVFKTIASPDKCTIAFCGPLLETLIGCYGAVGRIDDALELFNRIQGPRNIACLRAITFACSVASPPFWQDAISILHTSDIAGGQAPMFVDQVALGNAMLACSKANEWEESLRLLRLYGSSGVPIVAVNSLIASCGRGGRPDMSLEVLNEMESSYGLSPDVRSYRNAVIACNQAEHAPKRHVNRNQDNNNVEDDCSHRLLFQWWECALSLLRRMKEDKLTPDIQTYSSVISACEAAGQWQMALGVLQSMMDDTDEDAELNVFCFNAAIAACEKGLAWVEALELYERMKATKNRSLQPTVVTYGSLILALDRAGQKEVAITIWREAVRKGLLQPWRITWDGQGNKIRALDLHQFSAAMTRACLRSYLDCLLNDENAGSPKNIPEQQSLTIVVGKGLRSQGDPVLLPTVQALLWDEYGIRAISDEENTGRIFLSASILEEMIARKRWR